MTLLDHVPAFLAGATTFFAVRAWQWRAHARAADAAASWALRDRDRIIKAARRGDELTASPVSFATMVSDRALAIAARDLARRDYRDLADVLGGARANPLCPEVPLDPCQTAAVVLVYGQGGNADDLVVRIANDVRGRR